MLCVQPLENLPLQKCRLYQFTLILHYPHSTMLEDNLCKLSYVALFFSGNFIIYSSLEEWFTNTCHVVITH